MAILGLILTIIAIGAGVLTFIAFTTILATNRQQRRDIENLTVLNRKIIREAGRLEQFVTDLVQRDMILDIVRVEVLDALRKFTYTLEFDEE